MLNSVDEVLFGNRTAERAIFGDEEAGAFAPDGLELKKLTQMAATGCGKANPGAALMFPKWNNLFGTHYAFALCGDASRKAVVGAGVFRASECRSRMEFNRMTRAVSKAIILATTLAVASCGQDGGDELPKGQVVANIDGKDITVHELNAELAGVPVANAAQQDVVKRTMLQRLIDRRILAEYARTEKLDESPEYALQKHRAEEMILVNLLQRQAVLKLAPTTREDAQRFMAQNPQIFAERKVYELDQILFEIPRDARLLRAMQPLKSLEAIEALLVRNKIRYRRGAGRLDAVKADPRLLTAIAKLPAGEIFVIPIGRQASASKIVGVHLVPFAGDDAVAFAQQAAQRKRLQDMLMRELNPVITKGREALKYQPGFEPGAKRDSGGHSA